MSRPKLASQHEEVINASNYFQSQVLTTYYGVSPLATQPISPADLTFRTSVPPPPEVMADWRRAAPAARADQQPLLRAAELVRAHRSRRVMEQRSHDLHAAALLIPPLCSHRLDMRALGSITADERARLALAYAEFVGETGPVMKFNEFAILTLRLRWLLPDLRGWDGPLPPASVLSPEFVAALMQR